MTPNRRRGIPLYRWQGTPCTGKNLYRHPPENQGHHGVTGGVYSNGHQTTTANMGVEKFQLVDFTTKTREAAPQPNVSAWQREPAMGAAIQIGQHVFHPKPCRKVLRCPHWCWATMERARYSGNQKGRWLDNPISTPRSHGNRNLKRVLCDSHISLLPSQESYMPADVFLNPQRRTRKKQKDGKSSIRTVNWSSLNTEKGSDPHHGSNAHDSSRHTGHPCQSSPHDGPGGRNTNTGPYTHSVSTTRTPSIQTDTMGNKPLCQTA